jgi:hypothetical protein
MNAKTIFTIIEIVSAIMLVGTAATAVNKVAYAWDPDGNSASPFSPGKKGNGVPPGQEAKIIGPDAPSCTCDLAPGHLKKLPQ